MTVLRKRRKTVFIPGSAGQRYIPPTRPSAGYWTRTKTPQTGCLPQPETGDSFIGAFRLASYDEIKNYLAGGSNDKCYVLKRQMEVLYNTPYTATEIAIIDSEYALSVGPKPGPDTNDVAIIVIRRDLEYTSNENPAKPDEYWSFDENYTCSIIDGVEYIEAK